MKQNLLPPGLHHKDGIDRPVVNGLLALAAIVFAWDVSSLEAQESSARPWFERSIVGMEVGPTGAQWGHSDPSDKQYCRKWDGREIVKKCVEANAEYLVLWLRDGDYAYYNSNLLPKALGWEPATRCAKRWTKPRSTTCRSSLTASFNRVGSSWRSIPNGRCEALMGSPSAASATTRATWKR